MRLRMQRTLVHMSHVTHMNESRHAHERVMSRTWMSHDSSLYCTPTYKLFTHYGPTVCACVEQYSDWYRAIHSCQKESCISAKEPCISAEEPCVLVDWYRAICASCSAIQQHWFEQYSNWHSYTYCVTLLTYEWLYVTLTNASCHTIICHPHEWVMSHNNVSHTRMNRVAQFSNWYSCTYCVTLLTYEWLYVTNMNESCHTIICHPHEWVT